MPLPVKLQDVVDALEEAAEFGLHFLDKRTGEIVTLSDEEWEAAEADELISTYPEWQREMILKAREIQKSEDFVELPDRTEIRAAISDPREFRAEEFEALAVEWLDYEGIPYTREIT